MPFFSCHGIDTGNAGSWKLEVVIDCGKIVAPGVPIWPAELPWSSSGAMRLALARPRAHVAVEVGNHPEV
jgi:hypothetical protein